MIVEDLLLIWGDPGLIEASQMQQCLADCERLLQRYTQLHRLMTKKMDNDIVQHK